MRRIAILAAMAFVGTAGLAAGAAAGPVGERVENGGFELNDGGVNAVGWVWITPVSLATDIGFTTSPVYEGLNALVVGEDSPVTIGQTLNLVVGESYTFAYAYYSDGTTPNAFESRFGGAVVQSLTDIPFGGIEGWYVHSASILATTASVDLAFTMSHSSANAGYLQLDAVSVIGPSPVAAPGTLALLGLGLIGVAFTRRN